MHSRNNFMIATVLTLACSGGAMSSAAAATLKSDLSRIEFLGPNCKELGPEQMSVDRQHRLHIDLSSFPAATTTEPMKGCLMKIPYTLAEASVSAMVSLRGTYELSASDRIDAAVRIGLPGQVYPASLLTLEASPKGSFIWRQPVSINRTDRSEEALKISLTIRIEGSKRKPALEGGAGESKPSRFQPLELVLDHVGL